MVACAAVILSSCSKDDKNDSSPDKAKKRIVRVIYKDNSKTPSSQDISYQYDKEGKLIKTVDIYNGSPSTETFSYSANKIASILIDTKNITYNIDYLLDSNGRITQYSQEGDETSYSETYTYDNNGYVQSVQPQDDDYCLNFLWGNGNLMNVSGKGKKWEFVYNSDPCPSNIDITSWLSFWPFWPEARFVMFNRGKISKNLLSSVKWIGYESPVSDKIFRIGECSYQYEFDSDGYPSKITGNCNRKYKDEIFSEKYTTTYEIFYEDIK